MKKLTLSQRNKIEEMLNQRRRKFEIVNELDKTPSTIAREINRHKNLKPHNIYKSSNLFNCNFFVNFKVCTNLNNHPEIQFCEKTIYNYIEIGLFKD